MIFFDGWLTLNVNYRFDQSIIQSAKKCFLINRFLIESNIKAFSPQSQHSIHYIDLSKTVNLLDILHNFANLLCLCVSMCGKDLGSEIYS